MRFLNHARLDQGGFTLTELLVAIALIGLIMTGILSLLMAGNQSYLTGSNQVEAQAAIRAAVERMTVDIREAGYDPRGRACTAAGNPAGCFDAVVNPANVALNPTATSFMVQSDWNGCPPRPGDPPQAGCAPPGPAIEPAAIVPITYMFNNVAIPVNRGEQITYRVVGGTLCRAESAVDPPATPQEQALCPPPFGHPLVTGVQQAVLGSDCTGALINNPPIFQYCTAAGGAPATPDQIFTVVVNMRVGVQNQPPGTWQTGAVQVTMSDRIRLRNR